MNNGNSAENKKIQREDAPKPVLDKRMTMAEAVRKFVTPGITLHLAGSFGGPGAAICEIIRHFHGSRPKFTLVQSTMSGHALNFVYGQLVERVISTSCVDMSQKARPSRIIRKFVAKKHIEMESWSLCSLQQRLMAGAFGLPFMPTRSVLGSSIARDNTTAFKEIDDPFKSTEKVGIVKALRPDISIVHACAADPEGNTILSAPYGDDIWGSFAASSGVIVTTEMIVSTDTIKKYSALVKIPGSFVNAVVHTPFGVHPFSMTGPGMSEFEPYEMDTKFLNELHTAAKNEKSLNTWIQDWVLDCRDHEAYLKKIGEKTLKTLKQTVTPPGRIQSTPSLSIGDGERKKEPTFDSEVMILATIAREIMRSVKASGHKMILVGAGNRSTAAILAYDALRSEGVEISMITGNGQIGYIPQAAGSILPGERSVRGSLMLTDTIMTHGVMVSGSNGKCLSVLGAGQIDRFGNINSSKTATGEYLVGGGGANDAVNAREVFIILNQDKGRFAKELPYITAQGNNVTTVISSMGVFRKPKGNKELCLTECFPTEAIEGIDEKIERIRENCGWPLKLGDKVNLAPPPTEKECRVVESLLADLS